MTTMIKRWLRQKLQALQVTWKWLKKKMNTSDLYPTCKWLNEDKTAQPTPDISRQ